MMLRDELLHVLLLEARARVVDSRLVGPKPWYRAGANDAGVEGLLHELLVPSVDHHGHVSLGGSPDSHELTGLRRGCIVRRVGKWQVHPLKEELQDWHDRLRR